MKIQEARYLAVAKINPLYERLVRQYGVKLDLSADEEHLHFILEHYNTKREIILASDGEHAALHNTNYAKAVLISETVRMFLREIAPKRTRKKRMNYTK